MDESAQWKLCYLRTVNLAALLRNTKVGFHPLTLFSF
jgi:hypothetical protein